MCPIATSDDLALLASGEINRFRARQLIRHISECDMCRAAWAETQQMWKHASVNAEAAPSAMLFERIRHQIKEAQTASAGTHRYSNVGRRLILGALSAGVVLAGLTYATRTPDTSRQSSGIAFAQVEAAMGRIDTVTWRETLDQQLVLYPNGGYSAEKVYRTWAFWARLQKPALVRLRGTRLRTVVLPAESYQIFADKGGVAYSLSYSGIQTPEVFKTQQGETPQDRLRSAIIFRREEPASTAGGDKAGTRPELDNVKRTPWVQRRLVLEGKELFRFDRTLNFAPEPSVKSPVMQMDRQVWTFWVEPQTSRIFRREVLTRYANSKNSVETRQVSDKFQYNLAPPEGLFEVTPPTGTRYSFVPLPQRPATEQEQKQIEVTIRNAMDAWNRKDQAAFAAAWDFDYEVATKQMNDNRRRVVLRAASQVLKGNVSLKSVSGAFSRISGVYTRRRASDPFPPKEPNEFVVSASVQTGNGPEGMLLNMSRQSDGSFKIIRWNVFRLNPHYRENA